MKSKAHSREMLMTLLGDREWESQLAVNTYEKQTSLERDVIGTAGIEIGKVSWPWTQIKSKAHSREMLMALRGSRVEKSVGLGHRLKAKITLGRF